METSPVSSQSSIIEIGEGEDSSSIAEIESGEEQKVSLNHITLSTKSPVRRHAKGNPSTHSLNILYANDPDVSLSSYSKLSDEFTPIRLPHSEEGEGEEGGESEQDEGEEDEQEYNQENEEEEEEEEKLPTTHKKPTPVKRSSIPIKEVQRYGNILVDSFRAFKTEAATNSNEPTDETKEQTKAFGNYRKVSEHSIDHDIDSDSDLDENPFNTNRQSFIDEENEEEVIKNREEIRKGLEEKQRLHQIEKE